MLKRVSGSWSVLVDVVSLGRKERFKVLLSLPKLPTSTYTDREPTLNSYPEQSDRERARDLKL